ncbi:hypothetical protein [Curtobacterium sp. MCPF17_052]|uniref:hypothetical protein n=1 Tax=Curtobacterium sp. MCPF17_052 TaxID=2175655 RepID=UPI0024DF7E68|nr:hypothetical protein [Curtobacterium sp. MCPF17_052]WIB11900.1 hypothetical protein DEJ36_13625 [Curtobacterium sp. MCPF17_052]
MSVPYHRLPRVDANWRWWRPLVAVAVFLGFYLVSQFVIAIAYFVPIGAQRGQAGLIDLVEKLSAGALDPTDPLVLSLTLVSLVVLLPAVMLSAKIAGLGPYGLLSSVRTRIRWGVARLVPAAPPGARDRDVRGPGPRVPGVRRRPALEHR